MRWGGRKQQAAQCVQRDEGERGGKGRGRAFSFSPLSWLAKLAAKPGPAGKHAPPCTAKNDAAAAAPAFPSCVPKRTSPSPVVVAPGRPCSPPRRSPAAAVNDFVPRRLSVGNDSADAIAARRHSHHRRRHCSLGGDRELQPLGHLIPFSLAASPARQPRAAAAATPPDTDATAARSRRRRRRSRRLSNSGGRRSSFSVSGRMPVRVRVRSPRRGAVAPELERLAVVRRTRDPQRAFRESMVEMITASTGGGGAAPRAEELERLLACYLSLNADEHHDCIVKVFRQVWFEYINLQLLASPDAAGRRPPARG
ncbi:hypothetical protein ACP70R_035685 [Stipagrostis hirtigluma subsp. patula]